MPRLLLACILLFALFADSARLSAQSTFGSIVGLVRDPSGAAVAGITIQVRDIDSNTVRSTTTGGEGLYEVLNLKPGRYEITAAKSGFATAKVPELLLEARQTRRADLKLEIATVAQTVAVSAPLINTENPIIADSKSFELITQLPLNYRGATTSPLIATITVPGVIHDPDGEPSLGGGFPAQVEYSVDGISTHDSYYNQPLPGMGPSTEMLSEFKVTSVNNNAEFGQMGDVTIITRSGTNQPHGSALWYHQNAALDATIYGAPKKQQKVFNTFGGSLGGPLYLPNIYDGRNRTFFFVDYEGNRQPSSLLDQESVPTAAMRHGDLNGLGPAMDPATGEPFPGNVIPANRINPVARSLLENYYPLPNYDSGGTTSNYRALVATTRITNGYDVRLDHILNSRQQIFGRWSWKNTSRLLPIGLYSLTALLPPTNVDEISRNLILSHNYSVRPNVFNEFRFGFTLFEHTERFPIVGADAVATLGLQGLYLNNSGDAGGFPYFDFGAGTGFSPIGHQKDRPLRSRSWQFTDNLSWVRGRHSLKFGSDLRMIAYQDRLFIGANGEFGAFYFTPQAFSGNAFADFLLGLPQSDEYGIVGPNVSEHTLLTHFYGQDEWRVNSRLTLTFGLRWSLHPPMTEDAGNITNFDRTTGDVIVPNHTLPAAPSFLAAINACPGTTAAIPCSHIVSASEAGLGQGLRQTYYGNWAPRFGFAWRPFSDGKTVIRSGFGIFTQTIQGKAASWIVGVHSSDVRTFTNFQRSGVPPLYVLPQISGGPLTLPSVGTEDFFNATDFNYKDPRSYQWSLTVERELSLNTALRLSYVGSEAVGLGGFVDLNQQQASTVPYSADRRPYQAWNRVFSFENLGFANYDGLQAELTHRFSRGLYFQSSYLFSKSIGNAGGFLGGPGGGLDFPIEGDGRVITDRFNTRLDRGILSGPRDQRFLLTAIYQLPFGKGRTFAKGMNSFANAILGGWDFSTITLLQSGPLLTPRIDARGYDQSNTSAFNRDRATRPDRIGNGNLANPTPDQWFDITAFTPTPEGAGRFGNSGVGILRGPGTITIAGGLFKSFVVTEKLRMRMEATFTNLSNHPNFFLYPSQLFISRPGFGQITSVQGQENSGNRTGQVGIRLDW
jgi:Carboxypeptidase regulatory-like domain